MSSFKVRYRSELVLALTIAIQSTSLSKKLSPIYFFEIINNFYFMSEKTNYFRGDKIKEISDLKKAVT